jgi:hypothetical protein
MRVFSDFDVYERKYTYDEMKVMCLIDTYHMTYNLDYEDLCRIVEAVYAHWANDDERYEEKVSKYPWIEIDGIEEEGYIQAYAQRVLPEFIKLYKETTK